MSRFFRRKKKKEEKTESEAPPAEVESVPAEAETAPEPEPQEEEVPEAEAAPEEPVAAGRGETIPYHDSIQDRLMYLFNDSSAGHGIEGTDEFYLEFMAMGERFWIGKAPLGEIQIKTGAAADDDAHIRIANDVVSDLLSAATFEEFTEIFLKYYKNPEAGKFVKIEARKPITDLNRRGYARVPIMKLLIGSAR
ncbi:MAG: hypothetical protein ACTSV3_06350 [Candidatus Thorarchaeota archaeon]|nr:MAG: hypothetical protein DRO87_12485 [Candidatus Thorarchaeota archaeon]RLI55484.1 MAG: hypothetical protein DRP09_09795 [Candidatus Thorarchaeota archaeon]